ncbi:dihydropteroate synthase [uncultured Shimia sp.]|uniref:dihydropteroate synthase n=1 Tax=uncultured Shimia sp. TaxID=573152 RepID=UPI0025E4DE0C|nr:dihydropteroate synthase [uncultured Shimia sp.]
MKTYYRPIVQTDLARPADAKTLAGGWCWFTEVETLMRGQHAQVLPARAVPSDVLARLCTPRSSICDLDMSVPHLMGILNVTPDSFSDGGRFEEADASLEQARSMVEAGADLIDVGGESTRPGATLVPVSDEIARTSPVIHAIADNFCVPISIDTRKAEVASAAVAAGASLINDVSGFTYDPDLAQVAVDAGRPVCVMHAQGDPATMQENPTYDDVLLDVYDFLETQVERLANLGIAREKIVIDPGVGFGKTLAHNLALLARVSLFHGLGCPVLIGVSRKKFIGTIGKASLAQDRMPGSVAVALEAVAQGAQIVRVHDVAETRQALKLWQAVTTGDYNDA